MEDFGEVLYNVNLKDYNTYKIGGIAKYIVKPNSIDNLKELIIYLNKKNIKYFILGKGSNVILPDADYDGVIILLSNLNNIEIKENIVTVESGITLNKFIMELINNNLGGLENLYGIPGTLGGAIVQNAGCLGSTVSDYIKTVTYLEDNEIKTIVKDECHFQYRNSIFKTNKQKVILSASFKLNKKDKDIMKNTIKENQQKRLNTQPLEYPNAGSVFRNPENNSAGKLIDEANLKGYNINDAYISDKHANFIINKGNASSKDIIELIDFIKQQINDKYNIDLELEQEIIKY